MVRKTAYWGSTTIVSVMLLLALSYLTGNEQVVSGFAKAGCFLGARPGSQAIGDELATPDVG